MQLTTFLFVVAHPSLGDCHIMSDKHPSMLKVNHMFIPWPLEPVHVDKQTVKLYPVVDSTMNPPECTHPFQTNKTVITAPGINHCAMLNTLGGKLNLSAIASGILADWNRSFCHNWCSFANLTILLFHSNAGIQVNKTTTPDNLAVLLPVVNGGLSTCHKQVCFVVFS
jgi:hypothetical protein